ncbi:MAG TPA: hypothetical protein VK733_12170 [Gemmatimonadaceae bacterium]|nr:hypothetical protein [Gemmatimonadaceae bacterium]
MRTVLGTTAALTVAALSFAPLFFGQSPLRAEWLSGTSIVIGAGVIYEILSRRRSPKFPEIPLPPEWSIAVVAFVVYAIVAAFVFQRRPILIDEIALVHQAEIFASGHLWLPAPAHSEFFSTLQMVTENGRVYSQYPPGGPAMLVPFVLARASWLAGPFFGALSVLAFAAFLRAAEPNPRVRLGALALFAFAPFVAFMSGTHMSCVSTLAWILAGAAAIAHTDRAETPRPWLAFAGGLAFGVAATIRPADTLAFAIPAGIWSLRRWPNALAAAAGVAIPIGLMMLVNANTTGGPLLFGYEVFWGKGHELGFHESPLGHMHTPAEGLRFVSTYFLQLNKYLFETPIPSLLPAIAALAWVRRIDTPDRYLIASAALLGAIYAAYWHEGFFLGPRFFFALAPMFALWTARLPTLVTGRALPAALVTSFVIAATVGIPARATQWASSFATERWAEPDVARHAGVHNALVFVREGWEAELVARMWALGVPPASVERIVRATDACRLDSAITALESSHARAEQALLPLLRDSALVHRVAAGPGANIPIQAGYAYPEWCTRQVTLSARGVTPLAPESVLDDGNVYARDLGERDTLLLATYRNRPVFVLEPSSNASDALPSFSPFLTRQ